MEGGVPDPADSEMRELEICVDDLLGLAAAVSGGADRVELCSALSLGGLTPSQALVSEGVKARMPIHAMVRPRAGDFAYSEHEIDLIAEDVRRLVDLGVAGIVVGATDSNGSLNEAALARFRHAAQGIAIVLHRAVDLTPEPTKAVRIAAELGYDYVLTSGGAEQAIEGRRAIREMAAAAGSDIEVIAGGGITPENVAVIIEDTGVRQVHASASEAREWTDPRIERFGFATGPRRTTEATKVAALKQAIARI